MLSRRPARQTRQLPLQIEPFEVFAIRYAHLGGRHAAENFIGADPHEAASDLDYYVWAVKRSDAVYVLDTGFAQPAADRRGRTLLRSPIEALRLIGIDPDRVDDVILSHLHYDHAGNLDRFARARFHVQDREMAYATGRCMCHPALSHPFDLDDALAMVRHVYGGRVAFHDGDEELVPGLTLHRVGGHSAGLQVLRVWTRRGWLVLAADASHLYANYRTGRSFPVVYNVAEMMEGFRTLHRLAASDDHIIPGHDPLVMKCYPPPAAALEGIVVRLDETPRPG